MSVIFLLLKPVRLRVVKWAICGEATLCCIHVFSNLSNLLSIKIRGRHPTTKCSNMIISYICSYGNIFEIIIVKNNKMCYYINSNEKEGVIKVII